LISGTATLPADADRDLMQFPTTPTAPLVLLIDKRTGEVKVLDRQAMRLARLCRRGSRWGSIVKDLIRCGSARLVRVSVTYRDGVRWTTSDISRLVEWYRRKLGRRLLGYFWVAELQPHRTSGEPLHYMLHLLVTPGTFVPQADTSGAWTKGNSRLDPLPTGSVSYAMKYAQKGEQKDRPFPRGLRLFAVVFLSHCPIPGSMRRYFRLTAIPAWLANICGAAVDASEDFPKRHKGGGWEWRGNVIPSPYAVILDRRPPLV
jgi:hypothetical protein